MSKDEDTGTGTGTATPTATPTLTEADILAHDKLRGASVMRAALLEQSLTPEVAAKALLSELGAVTTKGQIIDGRWVYSRPQPLWEVRQKARQDLTRYWGAYKGAEEGGDGDGSPLVVEIRDFTERKVADSDA